ncbi:MAG: NCS2 family permease [Prolixibacteraceae bacterium]|jgi:AGZA family xanthine/uracil permease-like MFS transporter|nr:NCS2 family permease [Prolixibacteraceae bacterium]NLX29595.1 NCS2 family permease [Bacteroidales bacterium]HNQ37304.1 NCS2 family permease [Prolixibacteraceae bacterium]HPJ78918.1 NCS2 family permease [Prolixibacteraceae bacterium]HRV89514.1 NCS2 family permease [Prolixibacteraceae bacterium]
MLEKYFKLKENNTTVRTELLAGVTTFMTMAYILAVNPDILGATGMDKGAVFTATVISSVVATLVMALWAKLPFALAPGMGLNAFFAYTVVLGMGHSWQFALTAVFLEGLIFILLTAGNIREMIVNSIPLNLKHAISVGIGLFIAFMGLKNAGIVVSNEATFLALGDIASIGENPGPAIALATLLLTGALLAMKVRGALLIGIAAGALLGIPAGLTHLPGTTNWAPPSLSPIFLKFEFSQIFTLDMLLVVFTFLFVDMFDTVGTLVGVSSKANMLDEKGRVPRVKQAFFADAIGTTLGSALGTSTVTTYVESASGVNEGGRTGLTALTVALLFFAALFLSPLFLMIPGVATAPALVIVGAMMMTPVKNIAMEDFTESIPAFLTMIMMPMSFSISEGIMFGVVSYVLLKLFTGRVKEVTVTTWVLAALFLLKFML